MSASLLVELLTEELPPKALRKLSEAFGGAIEQHLLNAGLIDQAARGSLPSGVTRKPTRYFCTPRRLAVLLDAVLDHAESKTKRIKLMPASVAYAADGRPTAELSKRLQKEGIAIDGAKLERNTDADKEYVFLHKPIAGDTLTSGLQSALATAVAKLPIPKIMNYQLADGATTVQFVRPAHGLVALYGDAVMDVSVLGLKAGRTTHGHRFQGVRNIEIESADAYEEALAAHGKVVASFDLRRAQTERQLRAKAGELGASLGAEENVAPLLDEVSALVEYPSVYAGEFEREYLSVPQECLILTMRANQKYFPLFDASGKLTNKFLMVSNMDLPHPKNIVEGNQRVVRPRLADARFFFDTDKKTKLADRVQQLASVTYYNKLGTQLDRAGRVRSLAVALAKLIGADEDLAGRAALLAKADLVTTMVGEFPELQGVMGRYYALADGEDARVADAIEQHYRPRYAGDVLPASGIALAVALADKLETLAGMFGIGQQPSGDKDPFALRRHALGVIRMLVEAGLGLPLPDLVNAAFSAFPRGVLGDAHTDLTSFIFERTRGYLRDAGYSANEVESVLCMGPARIDLLPRQLAAVRAFAALAEAPSLAAANKRVANILKQAEAKGEAFANADLRGLTEPAERSLCEALQAASKIAQPMFDRGDYTGYLRTFAALKAPIDAFFDSVMVMVDDPRLRRERLALLADLRREMNRVADLSKLAA